MNKSQAETFVDLKINADVSNEFKKILTPDALNFLVKLHDQFSSQRDALLEKRIVRQQRLDEGELPDFLLSTSVIRESEWTISPIPKDLEDRRVEITGPASDRKMVINAFNSGAKAFMADFEDANAPSWENTLQGQINLRDAIQGTIQFIHGNGKEYSLHDSIATLLVRPRGWHLTEKHIFLNGKPMSASLFDFGLFFYHNAKSLIEKKSSPYFYLPKLESHVEARLWNDVFIFAQQELEIPQGTIKATVLIETILATFEADEILYELKEHSAGLNCGRWDYIFSYIKKLRNHSHVLLPDRAQITMTTPFMKAYTHYVIQTCHKRNAHAIGGMAAQIPIKQDSVANEEAMRKVSADKQREAQDGHDGTWVAHPGLVPIAMEAFNQWMPQANQIKKKHNVTPVAAAALLAVPVGNITEHGLRTNISVGIQYIEAWLQGNGAVPIFHLMEDAATAEISRAQVWQWIRHPKGVLKDGRKVTMTLVEQFIQEELQKIKEQVEEHHYQTGAFLQAKDLFVNLIKTDPLIDFLTIPGYEYL